MKATKRAHDDPMARDAAAREPVKVLTREEPGEVVASMLEIEQLRKTVEVLEERHQRTIQETKTKLDVYRERNRSLIQIGNKVLTALLQDKHCNKVFKDLLDELDAVLR